MSSDHSCMNICWSEALRSSSGHEWTWGPYFHVIRTHTDTWEECFLPCECLPTSLAAPISPAPRGCPAGWSWMGPPHDLYLQEAWAVPHREWAEETVSCISCPLIASVTHSNLLWNGTESEDFSSDVLFPGGIVGHEFLLQVTFPPLIPGQPECLFWPNLPTTGVNLFSQDGKGTSNEHVEGFRESNDFSCRLSTAVHIFSPIYNLTCRGIWYVYSCHLSLHCIKQPASDLFPLLSQLKCYLLSVC